MISVVFSHDAKCIASVPGDGTIQLRDAELATADPFEDHMQYVTAIAFSQDGQRLVSGSFDFTIWAWDVECGAILGPLEGHTGEVMSVVFSPDGERVVSGSEDITIRLWNAWTGDTILSPLDGHIGSVAHTIFSQDGLRIFSASYDKIIRVWDADTGNTLATLEPLQSKVISVALLSVCV